MSRSSTNPAALLRELRVESRPIGTLLPYAGNPRSHSKKQVRQIARSIESFGFCNPLLVDEAGGVIAGHGRLAAARQLGMAAVPAIELVGLNDGQKRALALADNKLAENAAWDLELLTKELQFLAELELDFDITVTGFATPEIDLLLAGQAEDNWDEADALPEPDLAAPAVSRLGDLWQLGEHRLLCGDATEPAAYERLLAGAKAQLVFTDPPYNVPIQGHVTGNARHKEFAMASGEMSAAAFTAFLTKALGHIAAHSQDGALSYVCMDWRHMGELMVAGCSVAATLINLCIWAKTNGGMGGLYRSQHELVFVFRHGRAAHINNVELGRHGRNRSNVWRYPGVNTLEPARRAALALHPTVKPVALVADAICDASQRGGLVLDPFGGSGTTLIAAAKAGRRGHLIELEPRYVDLIIARYQRLTGDEVRHAESGLCFQALQQQRHEEGTTDGG